MAEHKDRMAAVQALYSLSFSPAQNEDELLRRFQATSEAFADQNGEKVPGQAAYDLARGVWENLADLDHLVEKYAKMNSFPRVSLMETAILRLALYELIYLHLPSSLIRKEGNRLATEFGLKETKVGNILATAARETRAKEGGER